MYTVHVNDHESKTETFTGFKFHMQGITYVHAQGHADTIQPHPSGSNTG